MGLLERGKSIVKDAGRKNSGKLSQHISKKFSETAKKLQNSIDAADLSRKGLTTIDSKQDKTAKKMRAANVEQSKGGKAGLKRSKREVTVPVSGKSGKKEKSKEAGFNLGDIKAEIEAELRGRKTKSGVSADRASSGTPGLDQVMSGGFKRESVVLLAGGPGSGKTIMAMQFLVDGIQNHNEPGLYISFEQTEKDMLEDLENFRWNLKEKISKKQLVLLSYTPQQVEKVLKAGGGTVRDIIQSIGAKRVVVDSLTAFSLLYPDDLDKRRAALKLFQSMKKWDCTALLISEQEGDPDKHAPTTEEFEVDGVILLYNIRKGDLRQRALEIYKMRGTEHSAKVFPVSISSDGLVIYPEAEVF